jgi:hypothetical protein
MPKLKSYAIDLCVSSIHSMCADVQFFFHAQHCRNMMQNLAENVVDEHVVKQAVLQAVRNCSKSSRE